MGKIWAAAQPPMGNGPGPTIVGKGKFRKVSEIGRLSIQGAGMGSTTLASCGGGTLKKAASLAKNKDVAVISSGRMIFCYIQAAELAKE